ncbi:hypothetical protein BBO99_00009121 [Phytophthora kernoviae]|uniref:Uncharacterized protein n=2 Tax=Phytophthora kernoviae TaxID=325452 RepID=A0A421FC83_9STRA|nr:hypothetical protein G195_010601 [Phytophthora kernoviae 00238/432]KAG2507350.1 hypothetical protein JM16_009002 [Phytophthora kernoviae]KAG2509902.1 hypothetical protein JM18_009031 [Phytophthora kernoviae]RLN37109.1 hypothetical protein BBI17_009110 [Phytophthora kernoviae]RLN74068.1 hypothetical protein BBO99_00009121 [Phytophthora kernoviae]
MNSLLFLYLNLIRGPKIVEERRMKEEAARRAQEEADIASGKIPKMVACKKCDAPVDRTQVPLGAQPKCVECITKEAKELAVAKAEMRREIKMSPFLWFQCFIILFGLTVFFHRNYVLLPFTGSVIAIM